MKLNNAPTHEAIISSSGEIGEFRIRNSAKAFSILSSGLYANKIRAIIRELSCNAVDSHVAAGRQDTPFDVHLPNALEPWFSIRDYGVGLNRDQVTNIYTTYFESTKTDSNAFIGALGLGSKSPFSYTDNFTVTAVQGGVKGVYSAFINGEGVPSIILLSTENATDEPTGVEVKFSVNDRYDYSKFREEAASVYAYFKLQPVVSGHSEFKVKTIQYLSRDIIPGVHEVDARNSYSNASVAVMGNIAYPIEMPNAADNLADLAGLLRCNLELHFDIGELDFQASREGLSYIPTTIAAIKRKLELVNNALTQHLHTEADAIENLWERAEFLMQKRKTELWRSAVNRYITDTQFPLLSVNHNHVTAHRFAFLVEDLAKQYNIEIKSLVRNFSGKTTITVMNYVTQLDRVGADSEPVYREYSKFDANYYSQFVVNDTKTGAVERTKFHYRNEPRVNGEPYNNDIHVLSAVDRNRPMNTAAFFAAINNPPKVVRVSTLTQRERKSGKSLGANVTIMKLERKGAGRSHYYRQDADDLVWRDAGSADSFDVTKNHYYLPLTGFSAEMKSTTLTAHDLANKLRSSDIGELSGITVYGVRRGDIAWVKQQRNWVNIEDHVTATLNTLSTAVIDSLAIGTVDTERFFKYNANIVSGIKDKNSCYLAIVNRLEHVKPRINHSGTRAIESLLSAYAPAKHELVKTTANQFVADCRRLYETYPLFDMLDYARDRHGYSVTKIIDYINLVDSQVSKEKDI